MTNTIHTLDDLLDHNAQDLNYRSGYEDATQYIRNLLLTGCSRTIEKILKIKVSELDLANIHNLTKEG